MTSTHLGRNYTAAQEPHTKNHFAKRAYCAQRQLDIFGTLDFWNFIEEKNCETLKSYTKHTYVCSIEAIRTNWFYKTHSTVNVHDV